MSRFAVLLSLIILVMLFIFQKQVKAFDETLGEYLLMFVGVFFPLLVSRIRSPSFGIRTNFWLLVKFMFFRKLRVSFSYLIRIPVGDYYLLVKSGKQNEKNLKNRFQPPGGAYHIYRHQNICRRFSLDPDNMKNSDKQDIRKKLTKPYLVFAFLDWFNSGLDREVTPNREFFEELVDTGVLPLEMFKNPVFEKIKSVHIPVKWSPYNKINEYKLFDIFELVLSSEQEEFLLRLKNMDNNIIRFEDHAYIEKYSGRDFMNDMTNLSEHSKYML